MRLDRGTAWRPVKVSRYGTVAARRLRGQMPQLPEPICDAAKPEPNDRPPKVEAIVSPATSLARRINAQLTTNPPGGPPASGV